MSRSWNQSACSNLARFISIPNGTILPAGPFLPRLFSQSDRKLVAGSNERHVQDERLVGKLREPAVIRHARMSQSQLLISRGILVNQCSDAKLLSESPELTERCGPFIQVDKVRLDSSFREKSKSLSCICTFFDAEDLNFHCHSRVELANLIARTAHNPSSRVPPQPRAAERSQILTSVVAVQPAPANAVGEISPATTASSNASRAPRYAGW
jgi:hypothetical protein